MRDRDGLHNLEYITIMNFYNTKGGIIANQTIYKENLHFNKGDKLTVKENNFESDEYIIEDKTSLLKIRIGEKADLGIKGPYDKDVKEELNKHIFYITYKLMNVNAK